jgi:membrane-associated phospholipid phosphatase
VSADRLVNASGHRLFAWPGWRHLGEAYGLGVLFAIWLEVIYGGADYITGLRSVRVPVHFDWERNIPFVPAMTAIYLSIFPLFWIAPFVLRTRREVLALIVSMALVTLCAGVVFLLLPAELAYDSPQVPAAWSWLYDVADVLNLRYNLVPSLHVALSLLCIDVYSRRASVAGRWLLWAWGLAIALATLLTHQHHVLDVVTGFLLARIVSRRVCLGLWKGEARLAADQRS